MGFFNSMSISASGMSAQRMRMDIISQNLSNATTTRVGEDGEPYRRQVVVLQEKETSFASRFRTARSRYFTSTGQGVLGRGVEVPSVATDMSDFKMEYDPSHPDANEEGYVLYPNVDEMAEMVDMMAATRAFEANVTAFNAVKAMALKALEIGK